MSAQSWVETTLPPGYASTFLEGWTNLPQGYEYGWSSGEVERWGFSGTCDRNRAAWRHWTAAVLRGRAVEWCGPELNFRSSPVCSGRWEKDMRGRKVDRAVACGDANIVRMRYADEHRWVVGSCDWLEIHHLVDRHDGYAFDDWQVWTLPSECHLADVDEAMTRFAMLVMYDQGPARGDK